MPGPSPLLVGRDRERARLVGALHDGVSAVVDGPAGIGKTHLVRDVVQDAARSRPVVHLLASPATAGHPFGTLAPLGIVTSADDLNRAVATVLRHWSARAGTLLWIDDVQHVDPTTAFVVRQAVVAGSVQVVATHRSRTPLPPDLESLVTEQVLTTIPLAPLDAAGSARLARRWTGRAPVPAERIATAVELAGGNPLYLRELVRAAVDGVADLRAAPALEVLVGRPCRDLPGPLRDTLDLVAAAEPAPVELLDGRRDEVAALESAGWVESHGTDLRVDHPLRRAWLVHTLGSRRPQVHRELLEALAAHPDARVAPQRVVVWYDAAEIPADQEVLARAARLAVCAGDATTARQVAERLDDGLRPLVEAQSAAIEGRWDEALTGLDRLALHDGPHQIVAALWAVRFHGLVFNDLERAERIVSHLASVGTPEARRFVVRAHLWLWNYRELPAGADVVALAEALAAVPEDDPSALELKAGAVALIGIARGASPMRELFPTLARAAERVSRRDPARTYLHLARLWLGFIEGRAGSVDDVADEADDALAVARASHEVEHITMLGGSLGWVVGMSGRPGRAAALSGTPVPTDGRFSFRFLDLQRATHATHLLYCQGPTAARALLDTLQESEDPGPDPLELLVWRARTLLAEAESRVAETAGHVPADDDGTLPVALGRALRSSRYGYVAALYLECVTSDRPDAWHVAVSEAVPPEMDGLAALARRAADARLARDDGGLVAVAQHLERGGQHTLALRLLGDIDRRLAAPRGNGTDPERDELRRSVRAAVLRLLRGWDGAEPWWLPDLPSARRREIAGAVADGAAPDEVASRLALSRRTIESHLQSVYDYLGVHGRDALRDALHPSGQRHS